MQSCLPALAWRSALAVRFWPSCDLRTEWVQAQRHAILDDGSEPVNRDLQIGGSVGIGRRHMAPTHVDLHRWQHQCRQRQCGIASLAACNEISLEHAVSHVKLPSRCSETVVQELASRPVSG